MGVTRLVRFCIACRSIATHLLWCNAGWLKCLDFFQLCGNGGFVFAYHCAWSVA
jgi:hypothetical protein